MMELSQPGPRRVYCVQDTYPKWSNTTLQDEGFAQEWEEQSAERDVMRQIVEARMEQGLTQQELAERCGMKASNLCRLENGNGNPSVATLEKIARGLGRKLEVSFT